MSDTETDRWALPLLQPGQAQKEMFHNEAVATIDLIVQPTVQAAGINTPPTAPDSGQSWVVGDAPTGAWSGKGKHLAGWSAAGWRFAAPMEGLAVWVIADGLRARFREGVWVLGEEPAARLIIAGNQVVGPRQAAITSASGGAVIDTEARAALAAILAALEAHGLIQSWAEAAEN